jgi:hypothetical protein
MGIKPNTGHHSDGGGIQNHSAGDHYPYVVFIQGAGFPEMRWGVMHPDGHVDYFTGPEAGVEAFKHAEQLATQLKARVVTSQMGLIGAVARLSWCSLPRVAR